MTKQIKLVLLITILHLFGCNESKEEKSFKLFNEGVTHSLDAGEFIENGNEEEGKERHLMAIEKFKETLEIDNSHKSAASSIGFSFYEIRNYDEAINWFEKATQAQPEFAINYQFLGLSQINKGRIEEGEKSINKAFELDSSQEIKTNTIGNLVNIGNLSYSYGEDLEKEGKTPESIDYKKYGVRVLMSALEISKNDKEIGKLIDDYATKLNDEKLSNWVKEKMK